MRPSIKGPKAPDARQVSGAERPGDHSPVLAGGPLLANRSGAGQGRKGAQKAS